MSKYQTDLFGFFDKMNRGDFDYVDRMSDEEVKDLSPYVMLMWINGAMGVNAPIHIISTAITCSSMVFTLSKHPRLLLKLFVAANCDIGSTRYSFKKSTQSKESKSIKLIAHHYDCGYNEAQQYRKLLSKEDIKELEELYDGVEI